MILILIIVAKVHSIGAPDSHHEMSSVTFYHVGTYYVSRDEDVVQHSRFACHDNIDVKSETK